MKLPDSSQVCAAVLTGATAGLVVAWIVEQERGDSARDARLHELEKAQAEHHATHTADGVHIQSYLRRLEAVEKHEH